MDEETPIGNIETFMLHCHEWAYWNVHLGYAGVPPEFKPIYIPLKMKKEPVPIDTLISHLSAEDVSEIVRDTVIIRDGMMFVTEEIIESVIYKLSKRMDYYNKLKLVTEEKANLFWDSEKGEPIFKLKEEYFEESEDSEEPQE